jgi:hypothetical protein
MSQDLRENRQQLGCQGKGILAVDDTGSLN